MSSEVDGQVLLAISTYVLILLDMINIGVLKR
jgi:hypothetical protein